jgi:thiamine-phosphate pyrophosphorylase
VPPAEPFSELSQGARRVLEAVREMAIPDCEVHPADLLRAVWEDGSRGAEAIEAQLGFERLDQELAWLVDEYEPVDVDFLGRVLTEARLAARLVGRQQEIGTEHLLAGVLSAAPQLARRWEQWGLTVESLLGAGGTPERPATHAIEVDPELQLAIPSVVESAGAARVMDAAANRCREGLRVIEDCARFTLDDARLSETLKGIRHELASLLALLGADDWIRFRNTVGDVGTSISTPSESVRPSLEHVLAANCKRVEETLRTLEEFAKLHGGGTARRIESLRYRFYSVEQELVARRSASQRLANARLYLLATDRLCPRGLGPAVKSALNGGVDVVQLREKEASDQRLLAIARLVREWTREAGKLLIINDRPDIAALVDADGVHLGQDDLPVAAARKIVGSRSLIGVSTHSIEQARRAVSDGADYLGVGPVFPSATKEFTDFAGLDYVRQAAGEIRIPWFAIGGISSGNVGEVIEAGAQRVAVSSAICASDRPADAARELRQALDSTAPGVDS